jgi:ribosomal protein S27AE
MRQFICPKCSAKVESLKCVRTMTSNFDGVIYSASFESNEYFCPRCNELLAHSESDAIEYFESRY